MINEYIKKIDYASCLNVSKKKISLAIEKFDKEQKEKFINEDKILLCEDSINVFSKIFVEDIADTEFIIFSYIRSNFQWERGNSNEQFWATPINLHFNLSKLFFGNLISNLKKDGFETDMETFGYLTLKKSYESSSELWPYIEKIIDIICSFGNNGMGVIDSNYFGDNKFIKYRSRLAFADNFILSMNFHNRSKQRYGYKPELPYSEDG